MSASGVDMRAFVRTRVPLPDEQYARKRVRDALRGRVSDSRIAQAEARAERLVLAGGVALPRCIERAIAWALCATDPTPNPPPFAA